MHKLLIEKAQTVFENKGGEFFVSKSRYNDLIKGGKYSELFVEQYARLNEDVVVVSVKGGVSPVSFGDWVSESSRKLSESLMNTFESTGGLFEKATLAYASAQHCRDSIIEKAKRDVDELNLDLLYGKHAGVDFVVNREKRTIVALLTYMNCDRPYAKGIAKCDPSDCFNVHIGKAIALRRALGLEVPAEYLNVPQPEEVREGDVVWLKNVNEAMDVDNDKLYMISDQISLGLISIIDDSRE
jgi:hypothetical protein